MKNEFNHMMRAFNKAGPVAPDIRTAYLRAALAPIGNKYSLHHLRQASDQLSWFKRSSLWRQADDFLAGFAAVRYLLKQAGVVKEGNAAALPHAYEKGLSSLTEKIAFDMGREKIALLSCDSQIRMSSGQALVFTEEAQKCFLRAGLQLTKGGQLPKQYEKMIAAAVKKALPPEDVISYKNPVPGSFKNKPKGRGAFQIKPMQTTAPKPRYFADGNEWTDLSANRRVINPPNDRYNNRRPLRCHI